MESVLKADQKPVSTLIPMTIIALLFFIFGFVTWLNGSLIPFLKVICDLSTFQALYVTLVFYIAYTIMALPSSWLLARTGYKNGMAYGLAVMVIGTLMFIPAASTANYLFFLSGLFILGTGLTILQTAANPYLVILGPKESAAMRISLMGIVNKGAGVIVPLVFSALILSDLGDTSEQALAALSEQQLQALSDRLIMPYLCMAGALIFLIALVKFSSLPEIEPPEQQENNDKSGIMQFPQVILGAIALFAYVGVEVIAGDTIGLFGSDLGMSNFTTLTSYTMVFMVIGYILGVICIPKYLSQKHALISSAALGIICVVGIVTSSPNSSSISEIVWGFTSISVVPNPVFFVALMGLAHALVWPSIWPLALDGLGRFTAQGSALLIMGISGGALLPMIYGAIAESNNTQDAYWVTLPCYLFILFYALKGHKMRAWRN
ncbi:MAG: sugar MFS transporter [Pseudoalteromonas nigrifaciens]|uniref:sugar MFS transporter n=1 Tax=Pseudoalteromonas nigrifaciens TaxID=28109 RepID=UPI003F9A4C3A